MKRSEKSEVIAKIKRCFSDSEAVFVINQDKMTVAETEDIRKQLRGVNSSYLVAKNTLIKLAVDGGDFEIVQPYLVGQVALIFSKDITGSAKIIVEYAAKSDGKVAVVCGGYVGRLLSAADVKILAQLPSMDELRAKIVAVVQTPAQRLATLLRAPAAQIATVLKGYSENN